jgi:uroporphyrinogen decarboxylase
LKNTTKRAFQPLLEYKAERCRLLMPFTGRTPGHPPLWLMRQAGRYLPEYREVRSRAGSFLDLCYAPTLAAEVTLQPVRRYGLDAAILFSDILVVPDALGQKVEFIEGEGPRLEAITSVGELGRLSPERAPGRLGAVYETVALVRASLPVETALIGFCGAPWTVATYMVGGRGSADQADARLWAYRDPAGFAQLIDLIAMVAAEFLAGQAAAGADVLQIFDSWAGSLPDDEFERWVVEPTRRIVSFLKDRHPAVPIIGFPRGAGVKYAHYARATGVDGVGCDTGFSLTGMARLADEEGIAVQGNLDPLLLVTGGAALEARVAQILERLSGRPFIFNLGHGIVPETPPENVARLVELVRRQG